MRCEKCNLKLDGTDGTFLFFECLICGRREVPRREILYKEMTTPSDKALVDLIFKKFHGEVLEKYYRELMQRLLYGTPTEAELLFGSNPPVLPRDTEIAWLFPDKEAAVFDHGEHLNWIERVVAESKLNPFRKHGD